jgi:hypothetical protein
MGSAEEQGPLWGAAATDWAEVTTQTVAALCELIGAELDVLRSRPNLLIEAAGPTLFPEDAWVGRVLRVGEMRMRVDAPRQAMRRGQRRPYDHLAQSRPDVRVCAYPQVRRGTGPS